MQSFKIKLKTKSTAAPSANSSQAHTLTVKKHLERVYTKLGVATRTAAAGMAMNRIKQLHPQFEG